MNMAAKFEECLAAALLKFNLGELKLKNAQTEVLRSAFHSTDTVAVLPTGYGKSLIFQLLPFLMAEKYGDPRQTVIVVAPINAIMEEQVRFLSSIGVAACYLSYSGTSGNTYKYEETEESDNEEAVGSDEGRLITSDVSMKDLKCGQFRIIYAHPECLLKVSTVGKMLRSRVYQERVCGIVIDEVHMILEWGKEFRPLFQRLGELTCLYPKAAHIALTATAKPDSIKALAKSLLYENYEVVKVNPDRPNVFIQIDTRPPNIRKLDKYNAFIIPLANQLCEELDVFPLTIAYVENLEALGYCYQYLSYVLKDRQFNGKEAVPENRLFAQYHTDYTDDMKKLISVDLAKQTPTVRLVLATVALSMGLNAPSVVRVLHMRPPVCLESYMQEIGRAGRSGQSSSAVMYFNNSDISQKRKGMTEDVISFCKNTESCLRLQLVQYFGFSEIIFTGPKDECCKNCREQDRNR